MSTEPAKITHVSMQIEIGSSTEKVWAALVDNIGEWWPAEFFAGGEEGTRSFILEAWPGGRMYETWQGGGGALWGTITTVDPQVRLQVLGSSFPNWGGPSQWYGTWDLKSTEGGTLLTFGESTVGHAPESGLAEKDKGWHFLWDTLKAYIEGKPAPAWAE